MVHYVTNLSLLHISILHLKLWFETFQLFLQFWRCWPHMDHEGRERIGGCFSEVWAFVSLITLQLQIIQDPQVNVAIAINLMSNEWHSSNTSRIELTWSKLCMIWKIGLEALHAALQQCLCHLNGSTAATTGSLQGTLPGNIAPILLHWHLHWNSGNHCKQCTICLYHSAYIYIYIYIRRPRLRKGEREKEKDFLTQQQLLLFSDTTTTTHSVPQCHCVFLSGRCVFLRQFVG